MDHKQISISDEALKQNDYCWGGHTLIGVIMGEHEPEIIKVTYDEIESITDGEHGGYYVKADTTEGPKTFCCYEILFLNDFVEWCEDNNRTLKIQ